MHVVVEAQTISNIFKCNAYCNRYLYSNGEVDKAWNVIQLMVSFALLFIGAPNHSITLTPFATGKDEWTEFPPQCEFV